MIRDTSSKSSTNRVKCPICSKAISRARAQAARGKGVVRDELLRLQAVASAVETVCAAGFAAVALLTLALGSGATTVMFTVVNGVLLKPLPYPEHDRLVALQEQTDWNTPWGNLFQEYHRSGVLAAPALA